MSTKAFTAKVFRWLHQVNEDVELPASAAKVAIRLSRDFNEEQGGKAWSACKMMGDDIGLSERHVIRAIRALEARGHLRVQWGKQGRGHSSQYWMLDREPDLFDDIKPAPAPVFEQEKTGISGNRKPASAVIKPASEVVKPAPAPETLSRTHRRTIEGERVSPAGRSLGKKKEPTDEANTCPNSALSARGQRKKEGDGARAADDGGAAFERFWAAYPRHVAKEAARKAFARAIKNGVDADTMIAGAQRYAVERKSEPPRYTAHAATWLNGRRWDDPSPSGAVIDQDGNVVEVERPPPQRQREQTWAEVSAELLAELEERDRREAEEEQEREARHG